MEHSYTRDWKPSSNMQVMATRTILMERPPLCPSCHQFPPNHDEKVDTPELFNIPVPTYNEEAGRSALNTTEQLIKNCPNSNSDSDDWTENLSKINWTDQQQILFDRVEHILDMDQLARLAIANLPNEYLRRNAIIEKSVSRMRLALAWIHWEPRLTQWLHGLMMTHLSPKYMISYIDILQSLKRKIPTLVDKMLYGRPIKPIHTDYTETILKKAWEPAMAQKTRTLPNQSIIIVVPSSASCVSISQREKRWLELLGTLTQVVPLVVNFHGIDDNKTFEQITEQLIAIVRAKIREVRVQTPNPNIILVGFNAGAAIAMQVALDESVNSVVCLGFAFNTLGGVRGQPDDRILELTTPVLFILGQNAQKSSQEEIESLRERMCAQTLLVVVGSSDDSLRVKRLNRTMEGVSQTMIDNMIVDEIQEFATSCILNPPGPREPTHLNAYHLKNEHNKPTGVTGSANRPRSKNGTRGVYKHLPKHKAYNINDHQMQRALKVDVLPESNSEIIDMNSASETDMKSDPIILNGNGEMALSTGIKRKVIVPSSDGFLHLKPPPRNTHVYVRQQNTGEQSYTLGVNSIEPTAISNGKSLTFSPNRNASYANKTRTTPTKTITLFKTSPIKNDEFNALEEQSIHEEAEKPARADSSIEDIDLLDIPILFADSDGNILDDDEASAAKITKTIEISSEETVEPIDVLSTDIADDSTSLSLDNIETETETETEMEAMNSIDSTVENETEKATVMTIETEKKITAQKSSNGGNGGFIILNRNTLKHFKNVKHLTQPPSKIRKILIPTKVAAQPTVLNRNGNGILNGTKINISKMVQPMRHLKAISTQRVQRIPSNVISLPTKSPSSKQHMQLITKSNHTEQLNPAKSGILIRKNHLAKVTNQTSNRNSFTLRKLHVVNHMKSDKKDDQNGRKSNGNQNGCIKNDSDGVEPMDTSIDNSNRMNNSIKDLIADLES